MSKITVITAANEKFKDMAEMCMRASEDLGYDTVVYDLGGLGFGKPFNGRVFDKTSAKIPSKPNIIFDALQNVDEDDFVVWLDADALLWKPIDEIMGDYDIGVTVRNPKEQEHDLPINAGVVFIKKTPSAIKFMKKWIAQCEKATSDQTALNKLLLVKSADIDTVLDRQGAKVRCFACDSYNNFYFKKPQLRAKIIHYKSKHRQYWPRRTIAKIPKRPSEELIITNTELRFDTVQ